MSSVSVTSSITGYVVNVKEQEKLLKDLNTLQEHFILALNQDNYDDWIQLLQFLNSLPSDQIWKLASFQETKHYLVRIQNHFQSHHFEDVFDKLVCHFPHLQQPQPPQTHNKQTTVATQDKQVPKRAHSFTYHGGLTFKHPVLYHYNRKDLPLGFRGRSLTTSSLILSVDAIRKECHKLEVSRRIVLPPPPPKPQISKCPYQCPSLVPVYGSDVSSVDSKKPVVVKVVDECNKKLEQVLKAQLGRLKLNAQGRVVLETVEDVVYAFASGALPDDRQDVLLNFTDTVPWNPYQLKVVNTVNTKMEYFSASQFGILHIYPDGDCEHRSFAQWWHDRTLFNLIRQIKIFREYLKQKTLKQWRRNVSISCFNRTRAAVYFDGVRFHMPFYLSLLQINNLSMDLQSLTQFNISKFGCYSFENFLSRWQHRQSQIIKYLHKYFKYCLQIVSGAIAKINNLVIELQRETQHKPFVSDLPISLQKKELEKLVADFEQYCHRRDQIKHLLTLSQCIIGSYINQFVEQFTQEWMYLVLHKCTNEGHSDNSSVCSSPFGSDISSATDCLLQTELKFNDDELLHTSDCSQLYELLQTPLTTIVFLISSSFKNVSMPAYTCNSQGSSSLSLSSHDNFSIKDVPLVSKWLLNSLETNEVVQKSIFTLANVIDNISGELSRFCSNFEWFNELLEYLNEWEALQDTGHMSVTKSPKDIEDALMKGYTWLNNLSQIPTHFVTSYYVLCVYTQPIVNCIRPRLQYVIEWVQNHCITTINNESDRLMRLAHKHMELLSAKRYDLEGFAEYSQQLHKIQMERETEAHTLQLVLSLINTLTLSGVMVTPSERNKVIQVEKVWDECQDYVTDVTKFIEAQTPLKAQGLKENMEACENEVIGLVSKLNQQPYSNPSSDAALVLAELDQVQNSVVFAQSRLADLGKWRKAITGEEYTITEMNNAVDSLNTCRELWKCRLAFDVAEKQWLKMSFEKLDVSDMKSKLNEWICTLDKLTDSFPDDDPVLISLRDRIKEYEKLMPSLAKLRSSSLNTNHWNTLLSAIEVNYDPTQSYTLNNLLENKLLDSENVNLVNEVCHGAERESGLKTSVHSLQEKWEHKLFTFQQIPFDEYCFAFPVDKPLDVSITSTEGEKITKFDLQPEETDEANSGSYIFKIVNIQEILQDIEKDIVQLEVYRGFPHATGNLKQQLEHWSTVLKQLRELVELLHNSQTMWWNTITFFSELLTSNNTLHDTELQNLRNVSSQFRKIINQVFEDPMVLSLMEKRRGQKGFNALQGETLKLALEKVLTSLETTSQASKSFIEKQAAVFPRLLILSTSEILQALTHQGNPLLLLPILTNMFPAIYDLSVIDLFVSSAIQQTGTQKDEGFQIVSVSDKTSEVLTLCIPLPVGKRKTVVWLSALERSLRYSLSCQLTNCIMSFPKPFLGILGSDDDDTTVLTWLSDNVYQAVMLAIEIKWYGLLSQAIHGETKEVLEKLKSTFEKIQDYFIQLLRTSIPTSSPRILSCLRSIIALIKHKLEIISFVMKGTFSFVGHILYRSLETSEPLSQGQSKLSSVPHSLTNSQTSIATPVTAAGKLHLLPEALVASSKSLYNSRHSLTQRAVKNFLPSLPSTPTYCTVHCGCDYEYGFEYLGASSSLFLSHVTERNVIEMMQCVAEFNGGIVTDKELPQEVAKVLGRPYFTLSCLNSTMSPSRLLTCLQSTVQSGSILIVYNIDALSINARLLLTKWLQEIYDGIKESVLMEINSHTLQQMDKPFHPTSNASLSTTYQEHKNQTPSRIDWYSGKYGFNMLGKIVEIPFSTNSIKCNALFGFIGVADDESLIQQLAKSFRTVSKDTVDDHLVLESVLLSNGFGKASDIAKKLLECTQQLQDKGIVKMSASFIKQLSNSCQYHFDLAVKENGTLSVDDDTELQCVMKALIDVSGETSQELVETIKQIVSQEFDTDVAVDEETTDELRSAIKKEMEDRHLQIKPAVINKILELHNVLNARQCALLFGPSCCGKTTLYHILAQSYNRITDRKEKVLIVNINPEAYTFDELYGGYSEDSPNMWLPGILTRLFHQSTKSTHRDHLLTQLNDTVSSPDDHCMKYWFVLNGFDWNKLYWLESLIIEPHNIQLPNGNVIQLPSSSRIIIECSSFPAMISPSFASQCAVIKCHSMLSYKDLSATWLEKAIIQHNVSSSGLQVLSNLIYDVLPPLLEYISRNGNAIAHHVQKSTDISIHIVYTFLALLSSVLDRNSPKQEEAQLKRTKMSIKHRAPSSVISTSRKGSFSSTTSTTVGPLEKTSFSMISHSSIVASDDQEQLIGEVDELGEVFELSNTQQHQMTTIFIFAIVWSFGGYVSLSHLMEFSEKVREIITTLPSGNNFLPTTGLLFDYYLDLKTYQFMHWNEKKRDKVNGKYIPSPELERYSYITDLYQSNGYHVLLIGDNGSGKSSFLNHYIQSRIASTNLPITSTLTPSQLQSKMASRLSQLKKRQGTSKKSSLNQNTFLLDDLHLSSLNPYHQQNNCATSPPVVQLVSYIAEYGAFPDIYSNYQHSLSGIRLLGTSTAKGTFNFTPSLLRHLKVVPFFSLSNEGMCHVMQQRLTQWMQRFSLDCNTTSLVYSISVASLSVFVNMKKRFHCSPTNPQYHFSLHELLSLVDGLLLMNPNTQTQSDLYITNTQQRQDSRKSGRTRMPSRHHRRQQTGLGGTGNLPTLLEVATDTVEKPAIQSHKPVPIKPLPPIGSRQSTGRKTAKLPKHPSDEDKPSNTSEVSSNEQKKKKALLQLRVLFRLWCHECSRVFIDRCLDNKDKIWFSKVLETCVKYCYCGGEFITTTNTTRDEKVAGGRRARPGRQFSKQPSMASDDGVTQTLSLQLSELTNQGIDCNVMQMLLPRDKQLKFLPYDQVAVRGEDLSGLLFSANAQVKDYVEIGDGQLNSILNDVLLKNCTTGLHNVIINKEVMEHVVQLCRALVIPATHALLLGHRGTGRKTSCRLASAMLNATVFELNAIQSDASLFHTVIKEACSEAGLKLKTVVLLVDLLHLPCYDHQLWNVITEVMREGLSSKLFTSSELLMMSSKINSGKSRRTAEALYQALAQTVHPNLHVFIVWDTPVILNTNEVFMSTGPNIFHNSNRPSNESYNLLLREEHHRTLFNALLKVTQCKIHYQSWTKDSYSHIALKYWNSNKDGIYKMDSSALEALSYLAAHIHLSANGVIKTVGYEHVGWLGTVGDFVKCLQLASKMACSWNRKKEKVVQRLHSVLGKLYNLERLSNNSKWKLEDELLPALNKAEDAMQNYMSNITAAKEHYMVASQRCKEAEETINVKTQEVKMHKLTYEEEFEKIAPDFYAALEALTSVARSIVKEVMGYRAPPGPLMPVFRAICLLFDRPQTWLDCRQLMMSQHFFQSLRFFEKDAVPLFKIYQMEKILEDQKKFSMEKVSEGSQAVVPLLHWLTALVQYRKLKAHHQPFKNKVTLAENALLNAEKVYVKMRNEMLQTKATLEEVVQSHKKAQKLVKAADSEVQEAKKNLNTINDLLNSLSCQKKLCEKELAENQSQLDCVVTQSLLLAANCVYLGYLPLELHSQLWNSWLAYCKGAVSIGSLVVVENEGTYNVNINVENVLKLTQVLSVDEEQIAWEREEIFPDPWMLEKCLHWRVNDEFNQHCCQVIFDPLNYFSQYINGIFNDQQLHHMTIADLNNQVQSAALAGGTAVLEVPLLSDTEPLYDVLYPFLAWSSTDTTGITIQDRKVVPKSGFKLYIVVPYDPFTTSHHFISFLLHVSAGPQITSLLFSQRALSNVCLLHILHGMRRDLCMQHRAMLADFTLHQQQISKCQESLSSSILSTEHTVENNKALKELTSFALEMESQQQSAKLCIKETQQALNSVELQIHPYKSLSLHTAQIFLACQHLKQTLPQVNVTLDKLLEVLISLIKSREGTRFHSSQSSLRAYLNHLETTLTKDIHQYLLPRLFNHQKLYFLLLVTLYKELPVVCKAICNPFPFSMESLLDEIISNSDDSNTELISKAKVLESILPFNGLCSSLKNNKEEWNEFFECYSSLLVPFPYFTDELSLSHKLLLWKILGQPYFFDAIEEYISLMTSPDCIQTTHFQVPDDLPPDTPILSLFYSDFVLEDISNEASERGIPCVILSALLDTDIEKINEQLSQHAWIVIDHLYHCNRWINIITDIKEMLHSNVSYTDFRCFLPIPPHALLQLSCQVNLLSYQVIALPCHSNLSSTTMLQEYHTSMSKLERQLIATYSNGSLKHIINKILSLLPTAVPESQKNHELITNVRSSILSVRHYLEGTQSYTAGVGQVIASVVMNVVPDMWYSHSDHMKDESNKLIDFVKKLAFKFEFTV